MASVSRGTGPLADARITPCSLINAIAWPAVMLHLVTPNAFGSAGREAFNLREIMPPGEPHNPAIRRDRLLRGGFAHRRDEILSAASFEEMTG